VNSREVVRRTLEFEYPERVARSFAPFDVKGSGVTSSDFVGAGPEIPKPDGEWRKVGQRAWRRVDVWGNVWGRVDGTSKGEIVRGALSDLNDIETFRFPDFSDPEWYVRAGEVFASHPDRWHVGNIYGFAFSMARKLRRMEQYLMDLVLEREKIKRLHDRIDEQIKVQMKRLREVGADSIMFCEDWGTQTQTLISPKLWREEFAPRFEVLCSYAHSLGLTVFMHSCGRITAIIPDLVEAGVDLFQFDQPRVHGIDVLSEVQERGRVTFWCPVDIQVTLQTGDEALIRQEVRELLDKLWCGRGGFVAGYYRDNASIGLDPKWQQVACDEFVRRGRRELFDGVR
jgi:hypothetical protein